MPAAPRRSVAALTAIVPIQGPRHRHHSDWS